MFETFHPGEAAIIAILLAFVPYLLLRGPVDAGRALVARRSSRRTKAGEAG